MKKSISAKKTNLFKTSFLQALGVFCYCTSVGLIMTNGDSLFGRIENHNILGPMLFLTLFSTSALICGLLVFYTPVKTYLTEKDIKKSFSLVLFTAAWLILFILLIMASLILTK